MITVFRRLPSMLEFLAIGLAVPLANAAPRYLVEDLGVGPGIVSYANGINADGTVVGAIGFANSQTHAAVSKNGGFVDLGTLGGPDSEASAINDAGQIVGDSKVANGDTHALLVAGATLVDLGSLNGSGPGTFSSARAINNAGEIVGTSKDAGGFYPAFRYSQGVMTAIPRIGGTGSEANGINDSGVVVGYGATAGNAADHATVQSSGGIPVDLNTLGGTNSAAYAINASNVAVGQSQTAGNAATHAIRIVGGIMQDLGTLGGNFSSARDINASGAIVGFSTIGGGADTRGFFHSNGAMHDLNDLIPPRSGVKIANASGINDKGQIAATIAVGASVHAALLTPLTKKRPRLRLEGPHVRTTGSSRVRLKGTANDGNGFVTGVEFKTGGGGFRRAKGAEKWSLTARLKFGKNRVLVRALDPFGVASRKLKVVIFRS